MSPTTPERLATIEAILTGIDKKVDDQGDRLTAVESTLTSWKGGGIALAALISLVATLGAIVAHFTGLFSR